MSHMIFLASQLGLHYTVYGVCNSIMGKKTNVHTLIKKYFFAKTC